MHDDTDTLLFCCLYSSIPSIHLCHHWWRCCGGTHSNHCHSASTGQVQAAQEKETEVHHRGKSIGDVSIQYQWCISELLAWPISIMCITSYLLYIHPQHASVDPMFLSGPKRPQQRLVELRTDEWELLPEQVFIEETLGEGAFGEVYKGVVKGPLSNPKVRHLVKTNICITVAIKLLKGKP